MWKITFTYKGFAAGVFYNNALTENAAIESAKMYCCSEWDDVRSERIGDA